MERQGKNLQILRDVMNLIVEGVSLPSQYRVPVLRGNYRERRECHLTPDWLLIYRTTEQEAVLSARAHTQNYSRDDRPLTDNRHRNRIGNPPEQTSIINHLIRQNHA